MSLPNGCTSTFMYDISLSDQEFWQRVYMEEGFGPEDDDEPLDDLPTTQLPACKTCGGTGPCGYDEAGRPMFHSDFVDEYEKDFEYHDSQH